jgi:pilus assembly protein CpaB
MGKWRAVVPIVLALVIAVVASVLIYKWMKKQTAPKEVAKIEEVKIKQAAIAEVNLPAGTKVKAEQIKTVSFLEESLPPGYFSDPKTLIGRVVIKPINSKELILESGLAPVGVTKGGVTAILKPGKRAVALSGNKLMGVSGFVNPGDHVDILMETTDLKTNEKVNKTVFENVRILATGTQLVTNAEGQPSPVDSYTLEVTPEEGERLTLAASSGKLQFALRSVLDSETVLTTGATPKEILASYRPIEPSERVKPKKEVRGGDGSTGAGGMAFRKGFTLEVIKGLNRKIQNF